MSSQSASAEGSSTDLISLTVNYVPSKFSGALLEPSRPRRRRPKNAMSGVGAMGIPRGGGIDAFRTGEARIPGENDEDYDGVNVSKSWRIHHKFLKRTKQHTKLRWNTFKIILFVSNAVFSVYTLITLILCLLTWFDVFQNADVIRVGNRTELIFSTLAATFGLLTAVIGWAGILLNNRGFLAVYTFFLWITFAFLVVPGYLTYKKRTFNLEGKLNAQWSRALGAEGRLRIQNRLQCCGWFSPFVEATISQTCYARSILPGCKLAYLNLQRHILEKWYTISFGLVPLQLGAIIAGLLCSNHVTYRFGKGMMPKRYQLNSNAMKVIVDNYTNEIAEQYGRDIASDVIVKSGMQSYGSSLVRDNSASNLLSGSPSPSRVGRREISTMGDL
ncbi:tetraspanin Tsp2 [Lentinula boryana]|uniref:Tetraspanin Tsp2 n=1 Tax=Lentinula boryana TaxID=40481 RepID=A0ABQ8PY86_9AGAR|nr:tetraspanin Tsp2 [Lentinula boryana]